MISKAKILFYGAFKNGKPPNDGLKPLNFLQKLMLLRVRRFKSYSEIPNRISYFDWQQAKLRAKRQRRIFWIILMTYITIDVAVFMRRRRERKVDLLLEEREQKNISSIPRYKLFEENPYWDKDSVDYWREKTEKQKKEAEEREKLKETGKTLTQVT